MLATPALHGGLVLTWREEGVRDGKTWTSTTTAYSSDLGVRVDIEEKTSSTSHVTILYLREAATVHFLPDDPKGRIAINKTLLGALQEKLRQTGRPHTVSPPAVTSMHTRHSVNGFACDGYAVRRRGFPTRFVCLADWPAIGIDSSTRANFSALGELMTPFLIYVKRLSGDRLSEAEAVDTYSLPGGFPVREWEPGKDAMVVDFQLLSVREADTPASLFQAPAE